MKTAYTLGILTILAYLYLGLSSDGSAQRSWFYTAAGFLFGAWLFNKLFIRDQIHKPMLELEKKVNRDHEHVPDEDVRKLITKWMWYTIGRGALATGSFVCGIFGRL